jgi:hypothetical protein
MIGALSTPHLMSIKFFRDHRNGLDLVQQEQVLGRHASLSNIVGNLRCAIAIRGLRQHAMPCWLRDVCTESRIRIDYVTEAPNGSSNRRVVVNSTF